MLQKYSEGIMPTNKVNSLSEIQIGEFMVQLLAFIYSLAQKEISSEDLALLAVEINNEVSKRHKDLTIAEVELAFRNGVNGKYGEYYSITSKSFYDWLLEYRKRKVLEEQKKQDSLPINEQARIILSELAKRKNNKP
jgi:hypothetical protein